MSRADPRAAVRGLYAIADSAYLEEAAFAPAVGQTLTGGARVVQYRDKHNPPEARRRIARSLAALCARERALFIINDDVALAAETGASVHLGRDDPDPRTARARLAPGALIGVSCYDELDRALAAEEQGADYVAFGSFFPSTTKPGAVRAPLALLAEARRRVALPIVAIGGITPENAAVLIAAGADAVAVAAGIFAQPDIGAAARRYARLFDPPRP